MTPIRAFIRWHWPFFLLLACVAVGFFAVGIVFLAEKTLGSSLQTSRLWSWLPVAAGLIFIAAWLVGAFAVGADIWLGIKRAKRV
jgi:threonine/homoserine/homoserine lactone efflux protein